MVRPRSREVLTMVVLAGLVLAMIGSSTRPVAAQTAGNLGHDIENGCGSEGTEWVPDTDLISEVLRLVALPVGLGFVSDFLKGDDSRQIFNIACNVHDRCYGTLGMSQFECDKFFYANLADGCRRAYLPTSNWKSWIAIWDAPYFAICSVVSAPLYAFSVGAAGGAAYSEAQIDARLALQCGPSKPDAVLTGLRLTTEVLERAVSNGCHIVDTAFGSGHRHFGDGRWGAIASLDTPFGTQRRDWVHASKDINTYFLQRADQGYALTDVEYGTDGGDDNWQLVFSRGLNVSQRYRKTAEFDDFRALVRESWDDGFRLVEIEQGDDEWVLVGHTSTGIGLQEITFGDDDAGEMSGQVAGQASRSLHLHVAEYAEDREDWVVVWSQMPEWTASGLVSARSFHDLSSAIEGLWNAGRKVHDVEFGNGEWVALWHEEIQYETVPPCSGRDEFAVRNDVAQDFQYDIVEIEDASRVPGEVAYCDPPEGTQLERGSLVTIYVYAEPFLVGVPDLRGMTISDADYEMRVFNPSLGDLLVSGDRPLGEYPCGSAYGEGEIFDQSPSAAGGPVAPGTNVRAWVCTAGERTVDLAGFWYSNSPVGGSSGDLLIEAYEGWWEWSIGEGFEIGTMWPDVTNPSRVCGVWDNAYTPPGGESDCGTLIWDTQGIRVVQVEWDGGMWFWREGYDPACPPGGHCVEF